MHARVTTFRLANGGLDRLVETIDASDITQVNGNQGAFLLIDRNSGEAMTITLWDSEQALQDAVPFAAGIFSKTADYLIGEPSRKVFEVTGSA